MNLLFDLDGTLTDSARGIAKSMVYAMERLGRIAPDRAVLQRQIGPPIRDTFVDLLESPSSSTEPHLPDEAVRLFRERYADVGLFENAVYEGVHELLIELSGHRLFVATSKAVPYAKRIMQHFGLADHFDAIYGSDLNGSLTHKPELVAHILRDQRIDPTDSVMIGDTAFDMQAGRECGLTTIGVTWGYGRDLIEAGADHIVDAPHALPKVIECLVP